MGMLFVAHVLDPLSLLSVFFSFPVVIFYLCVQDECKRLRQSIRCGLTKRLTVVGLLVMLCYMLCSRYLQLVLRRIFVLGVSG